MVFSGNLKPREGLSTSLSPSVVICLCQTLLLLISCRIVLQGVVMGLINELLRGLDRKERS
jgi:hypothetical protein